MVVIRHPQYVTSSHVSSRRRPARRMLKRMRYAAAHFSARTRKLSFSAWTAVEFASR